MRNFQYIVLLTGLLGSVVAQANGSETNNNEERSCYACNPEVNLNPYDNPQVAQSTNAGDGSVDPAQKANQ
jgi:hypothetical protein